MTIDTIQILYYAGFALLGWWLRHQGIALPSVPPAAPAAPASVPSQQVLVELLKSVLDRLAPPAPTTPTSTGNVVHVPIEVAANVKQPQG